MQQRSLNYLKSLNFDRLTKPNAFKGLFTKLLIFSREFKLLVKLVKVMYRVFNDKYDIICCRVSVTKTATMCQPLCKSTKSQQSRRIDAEHPSCTSYILLRCALLLYLTWLTYDITPIASDYNGRVDQFTIMFNLNTNTLYIIYIYRLYYRLYLCSINNWVDTVECYMYYSTLQSSR